MKLVKCFLLMSLLLVGCAQHQTSALEDFQQSTKELVESKGYDVEDIENLEDYQIVDEPYDNEVLERFNQIQGYMYTYTYQLDGKDYQTLMLDAPTEENMVLLAQNYGVTLTFQDYIILPVCFEIEHKMEDGQLSWVKQWSCEIDGTDDNFITAEDKYLYMSEEQLFNIFIETEGYVDDHGKVPNTKKMTLEELYESFGEAYQYTPFQFEYKK